VAIALRAVIAGAKDWDQIADFGAQRRGWLKTFLALPNGIPSSSAFERVFAALSPRGPAELPAALAAWLCARPRGFPEKDGLS
jgi:hypothetical protein